MPFPQLTTQNIRYVETLGFDKKKGKITRPVFLVTMSNGQKLVVKAEYRFGTPVNAFIDRDVQWGGKLMKQVSPQIHGKVLSVTEISALHNLGFLQFRGVNARDYLRGTIDSLDPTFTFYKMEYVEHLSHLDVSKLKAEEKREKLHKALKHCREDRNVLFQLGEIAAVDLFIGNHDRFLRDGSLGNEGNLFLQDGASGMCTPVGLDFYHAGNEFSKLHDRPLPNWPGKQLKSIGDMYQFATNAVTGLNEYFNGYLGGEISPDQLIGREGIHVFEDGLHSGRDKLKTYLNRRLNAGQPVPPGLAMRMQMLGWWNR
jgi:hypothetical protein